MYVCLEHMLVYNVCLFRTYVSLEFMLVYNICLFIIYVCLEYMLVDINRNSSLNNDSTK